MKSSLNINRRDVIRQQHNLIRVKLLMILPFQILRRNQTILQQPHHKSPRPRKRIENMHIIIRQTHPKLLTQRIIRTSHNKIHHLHRRIHNSQPFRHARKSILKKLIVKLNNNLLLTLSIINPTRSRLHTRIKLIQSRNLLTQRLPFQSIQHLLHRNRNRI